MRLSRRPPAAPRRRQTGRAAWASSGPASSKNETADPRLRRPIAPALADNLDVLQDILLDNGDVKVRKVKVGPRGADLSVAVLYVVGLVEEAQLEEGVLKPILIGLRQTDLVTKAVRDWPDLLRDSGIAVPGVKEVRTLAEAVEAVLDGDALILIDQYAGGLAVRVPGWAKRSIAESFSERVVRGPHDGFTEDLSDNIGLIRYRIKDPHLKVRTTPIGRRTQTEVAMVYIDNLANPALLDEVRSRLDSIDIDGFTDTGMLEHHLSDTEWTPFPMLESTERADRTVLALLQGRVAILAEGSPFAIIAPTTLNAMMSSPEDYNLRWPIASFLRLLRVVSSFVGIFLPPMYIALTSFHPEMLPTPLLISLGTFRMRTPFPAIIEALAMETVIEILREAGLRLPTPLGPTIGVVGGIVVGDAAIRAGLVSPALVIVVGLTTIASFAPPNYEIASALRFLRFPIMILAGAFGLYGLVIGLIAILIHLVNLRSFGTYYLAPLAPQRIEELKDSWIRLPALSLHKRPDSFHPLDLKRASDKREEVIGPKGGEPPAE